MQTFSGYFYELGREEELSLAELYACGIAKQDVFFATDGVLVVSASASLPNPDLLGGIRKHGRILGSFSDLSDKEHISQAICAHLLQLPGEEKIRFGISLFGKGASKQRQLITRIGMEVKKAIKSASDRSVRFVSSQEPVLSSVIVRENGLLQNGAGFVLINSPDGYLLGQTTWVQDYRAWSERDYGRPARDAKSGMLPPKLARIMINLSQTNPKSSSLLDPFCGSGTIPMEAEVLGYKQIFGSDISERAIADSKENLRWLGAKHTTLSVCDARHIQEQVDPVDAIVAEGFLGPAHKGNESVAGLRKTLNDLLELYQEVFPSLVQVLKPGGKIVFAFPFYQKHGVRMDLAVQSIAEKNELMIEGRHAYRREDQNVGRDIVIMSRHGNDTRPRPA